MSGLNILGIVVAGIGVVVAVFPDWFGPLTGGPEPPADVYEAIERRVRGGMVLGVGLVFIAVTALRPWSTSVPSAIFYFMLARLRHASSVCSLMAPFRSSGSGSQWRLL